MEEVVTIYLSLNVDGSYKQSLLGHLSGLLNDSKTKINVDYIQKPSSRGFGGTIIPTGMKTIIVIF